MLGRTGTILFPWGKSNAAVSDDNGGLIRPASANSDWPSNDFKLLPTP